MAGQLYAALELPNAAGSPVWLPVSPAMARRLCLWSCTANSHCLDETDWLGYEPTLMLWASHYCEYDDPTSANLQSWLAEPATVEKILAGVQGVEFMSEQVASMCERACGAVATDSERSLSSSELTSYLERLQFWADWRSEPTEARRASENASGDWEVQWNGDPAWHTVLLARCGRDHIPRSANDESIFAERLQQEKLLAMKQLAYGASHEINNPLANIATRAQTLLVDETDPRRRRTLATINQQAFRAHEMIADMMLFAMPPKMERQEIELSSLLTEVMSTVQELADENNVRVNFESTEAVSIVADETQLAVAFGGICRNSIEAMPMGGQLIIHLSTNDLAEPAYDDRRTEEDLGVPGAVVTIRDEGPGLSDRVRRHLFDPFFSGREAGRGLGFGLSKAWRIITELGGQIVVESPAAGGSEFTVRIPWQPAEAASKAVAACDKSNAPLP